MLALLRSRFIHLNWVVVGRRETVLKELGPSEGGLPAWITVLENPSDSLLKACYAKALCLMFPSSREGFGIPLLEAFGSRLPVVRSSGTPKPPENDMKIEKISIPPANRYGWICASRQNATFFWKISGIR